MGKAENMITKGMRKNAIEQSKYAKQTLNGKRSSNTRNSKFTLEGLFKKRDKLNKSKADVAARKAARSATEKAVLRPEDRMAMLMHQKEEKSVRKPKAYDMKEDLLKTFANNL